MHKDAIKKALKERELSIRQLCFTLEIREASVSKFLAGTAENIGIPKLEKILKHLDLQLASRK